MLSGGAAVSATQETEDTLISNYRDLVLPLMIRRESVISRDSPQLLFCLLPVFCCLGPP